MYVLTGGRATGKTSAVIRWLMEDPQSRGIIVANEDRRRHMMRAVHDAWSRVGVDPGRMLVESRIIVLDTIRPDDLRGNWRGFRELAIDDADAVLSRHFGSTIDLMTVNATWIPLGPPERVNVQARVGVELPSSAQAPRILED